MSINESVIKTIGDLESKLQELRKIVGLGEVKKMRKNSKKSASATSTDSTTSDEPVKEKRAPSGFIIFQGRLRELLRANNYPVAPKDGFPQFAGYLNEKTEFHEEELEGGKKRKVTHFDDWTDEAILAERASWTKPEVSKQAAAGKNKRDSASVDGDAPVAEASSTASAASADGRKKRGPHSEETKAKMKAAHAARKSAPTAPAEPVAPTAPAAVAAAPAAAPAAVAEPVAAAPAPAKKTGKQLVKKAAPKKLDLRFREWVHEGTTYYKNERGDVIDEAMSWVGRFSEASGDIDTTAEAPEDLGDIELIE